MLFILRFFKSNIYICVWTQRGYSILASIFTRMKVIKNIITSIYSLYVILMFFATMLLVLIPYILISPFPRNTRMRFVYKINIVWITSWAFLCGMIFKPEGLHHIEREQPYVLVSNHRNMLDVVITGSRIQHPFQPLVKEEVMKIPLFGTFLLRVTSIPVNRSNAESRKRSFQRMVDRVKEGTSILIFAEGTRNRTPHPLKTFYAGGFRLAIETQVPILPIVLLDIYHQQPVDSFKVYPGIARMHLLPPISTEGMTEDDVPMLQDKVHEMIWNYLTEHDKDFQHYKGDRKEVLATLEAERAAKIASRQASEK